MDQETIVGAIRALETRAPQAPTTTDIAAQLGEHRNTVRRWLYRLQAAGVLIASPGSTPRWHVRGALQGAEGRMHALIIEAGKLTQGMDPSALSTFRSMLLDAMEGRR